MKHDSDCATNNMPAKPNGLCDCGAEDTAALIRDAARYRWLRAQWWTFHDIVWDEAYFGITHHREEALDDAIDRALNK